MRVWSPHSVHGPSSAQQHRRAAEESDRVPRARVHFALASNLPPRRAQHRRLSNPPVSRPPRRLRAGPAPITSRLPARRLVLLRAKGPRSLGRSRVGGHLLLPGKGQALPPASPQVSCFLLDVVVFLQFPPTHLALRLHIWILGSGMQLIVSHLAAFDLAQLYFV
jgi:hypothetical protein